MTSAYTTAWLGADLHLKTAEGSILACKRRRHTPTPNKGLSNHATHAAHTRADTQALFVCAQVCVINCVKGAGYACVCVCMLITLLPRTSTAPRQALPVDPHGHACKGVHSD